MSIEEHDEKTRQCRTLGHEVPFGYCRQVDDGLPCENVLDCWFEQFPIEEYLRRHYSEQQIEKILQPPQPKLSTLAKLVDEARKRTGRKPKDGGGKASG